MVKKFVITLVSLILIVFFLSLSIWVNISSDKLVRWLEYQINTRLPANQRLTIDSAETHFTGLDLKYLKLIEYGSQTEMIALDRLNLQLDLVSLLVFREIPFDSTLYNSHLTGTIQIFPKIGISFDTKDLEPNRNPFIRQTNVIRSNPQVSLNGELFFDTQPTGRIGIKITNLILSGEIQDTHLPLRLPQTRFESVTLNLTLDKASGQLTISTIGDINGSAHGTVMPNWKKMASSRYDISIRAEITNTYGEKLGIIKNILESYSNKSGQISIRIRGNLKSVKAEAI